ncbi:hypothetical protein BDY21DRAFT_406348 [Lineolata rhizophorae]|uniref:Uncharacterized protein n=1 Tax=Lineolata rhizophorae TaxID=578093 RepID=A0A6A6P9H1_9PEZI|nr:hypothetical protein BDY21DRAFT_406348 [Lineolata rhizophorae]
MPLFPTAGPNGQRLSFSLLPRRIKLVLGLAIFCTTLLFIFGAPSSPGHYRVPTSDDIIDTIAHPGSKLPGLPNLPHRINPFAPPAHKPPPEQANSTSGETRWFSDWKWRNPFSSSITLDENRAVLPPLRKRTPIYTFYDAMAAGGKEKKSEGMRRAEERLLLAWRRAWWAQGFKPLVLGRPEAMNNPLYERVQRMELDPAMEVELMRWLAWGNMGRGVLANYLALPMAHHEDHMLSFLRRGEFPSVTRFEGLESSVLAGEKAAINAAIVLALDDPEIVNKKSMLDAVPKETISIDKDATGVAFYDRKTIAKKYKPISTKLDSVDTAADGLADLAVLVNAHLHNTWQNTFSNGVAVLNPLPERMTTLLDPAIDIGRNLTTCPASPIPSSCPPNKPKCKPCPAMHPLRLAAQKSFRNSTTQFTIGVVPHPWTTTVMAHLPPAADGVFDARFVRRNTTRDAWLASATKDLLGTGIGAPSRALRFKDVVASEWGTAHTLWLTAERPSARDVEWVLGFALPGLDPPDRGTSDTPVPGPERKPPPPPSDLPDPVSPEEDARERALLRKARDAIKSKVKEVARLREAVEAWNLADTEAWRFARAFGARRRVEREVWEEEERKFAGAEERVDGWGSLEALKTQNGSQLLFDHRAADRTSDTTFKACGMRHSSLIG